MRVEVLYSRQGYGIIKGEIREVTDEFGNLLISKGLAKELKKKKTSKSKKKSRKDSDYDTDKGSDITS